MLVNLSTGVKSFMGLAPDHNSELRWFLKFLSKFLMLQFFSFPCFMFIECLIYWQWNEKSRFNKTERAFAYHQILAKQGPDARFVIKANIARLRSKLRRSRVINLMNRTPVTRPWVEYRVEYRVINWLFKYFGLTSSTSNHHNRPK